MTDQNTGDAYAVYTAIRNSTISDGWVLFAQVIKVATDQAFDAGLGSAINYLQAEDFNIPNQDYDAMKALKPE